MITHNAYQFQVDETGPKAGVPRHELTLRRGQAFVVHRVTWENHLTGMGRFWIEGHSQQHPNNDGWILTARTDFPNYRNCPAPGAVPATPRRG